LSDNANCCYFFKVRIAAVICFIEHDGILKVFLQTSYNHYLGNGALLLKRSGHFNLHCIEGIEMRQLAFRSANVYCQNVNILKCTLALFLYANGKKGKQANSERDRERESASMGALQKDGPWHPS
jgi:hypothetical protein